MEEILVTAFSGFVMTLLGLAIGFAFLQVQKKN
jgi:hypothetical protein